MKYVSIAAAQNTYAVFVTRADDEEVEATVVPAWALTDSGATIGLMPSQVLGDPNLIPVESDEKRTFKTFYFGTEPVAYIQQYLLKLRDDKLKATDESKVAKVR